MARITEHDSSRIFGAARKWRDQCLIAGRSLLWEDRELWSPSNLQRFKDCFIDRPDTSKDKNFEQKFKSQLATEDEDVTRLACELLFIYFLFPTSVGRSRKAGLIREVASWRGVEIDDKAPLFDAFDSGIGDPGLVYNTGRPNELTYLNEEPIASFDTTTGTWWAGRYIGEVQFEGRTLRLEPRFGMPALMRWLTAIWGVRLVDSKGRYEQQRIWLWLVIAHLWAGRLIAAAKHGLPFRRVETVHYGRALRGRLLPWETALVRAVGTTGSGASRVHASSIRSLAAPCQARSSAY